MQAIVIRQSSKGAEFDQIGAADRKTIKGANLIDIVKKAQLWAHGRAIKIEIT